MLEWLKRHAWKACSRLKRLTGSNPVLSAKAETISKPNLFEHSRWSLLLHRPAAGGAGCANAVSKSGKDRMCELSEQIRKGQDVRTQ